PNPFMSMLPLVVIAVLFYFLLIRPQQKQAKEREKLLKDLKEGDKVVLVSGVFATVTKIEDEGKIVRLQIADNVVVKANRVAIERLQG
ncbi:MAG TPA: preprotein translocase subunit YajC, partial [bacterium]|nr:preprotein translocase subunit YajC [bacterium]